MSRRNKHAHMSTSTTQVRPTPQTEKPIKPRIRVQRSRYRKKTSWWGQSSFLLTGIGFLLVGLMVVFGLRFFSNLNTTETTSTTLALEDAARPTMPGDSSTGDSGSTGQKASSPWSNQEFVSTVLHQVAEKLHLPFDQLATKVQSGLQIEDVAAQQGFSATQLHSIEIDALQVGIEKLASTNQMSQDDADIMMNDFKSKTQQKLNSVFTYELGGTPPLPPNATPTVLPK